VAKQSEEQYKIKQSIFLTIIILYAILIVDDILDRISLLFYFKEIFKLWKTLLTN
jgi:hypoxanthine phosphoribosyltransferase